MRAAKQPAAPSLGWHFVTVSVLRAPQELGPTRWLPWNDLTDRAVVGSGFGIAVSVPDLLTLFPITPRAVSKHRGENIAGRLSLSRAAVASIRSQRWFRYGPSLLCLKSQYLYLLRPPYAGALRTVKVLQKHDTRRWVKQLPKPVQAT
jgi:hypothetical protein